MRDIAVWVVLAYVIIVPWTLGKLGVPAPVRIAASVLGLIPPVLYFFGKFHVFVPKPVGIPLTIILMIGIFFVLWRQFAEGPQRSA